MRRKLTNAPVRRVERIKLGQVKRAQGRPKKAWMKVIRHDIEAKGLNESKFSIGMSRESRSMCPIRRNSLLVHVAYPQILGTNGLVVIVIIL